jgi:hypothetical protein
MRRVMWLPAAIFLLGCASIAAWLSPEQASEAANRAATSTVPAPHTPAAHEVTPLPTGPKAPAITNDTWLNTRPLAQDQLNGQVVLVDFWTFG